MTTMTVSYTTILALQSTVSESSLSACVVMYPVRRTALFLEVVHVTVTVDIGNVPMTHLAFCYTWFDFSSDDFRNRAELADVYMLSKRCAEEVQHFLYLMKNRKELQNDFVIYTNKMDLESLNQVKSSSYYVMCNCVWLSIDAFNISLFLFFTSVRYPAFRFTETGKVCLGA